MNSRYCIEIILCGLLVGLFGYGDLNGRGNERKSEKWSYLGLENKANRPVPFARGLVSTKGQNEYGIHFSNDLSSIFFTRSSKKNPYQIFVISHRKGGWKKAELLPFIKSFPGVESCLSHDGKRFVYQWIDDRGEEFRQDFYGVVRLADQWGTPKPLSKIDFGERTVSPSLAKSGNLFYSGDFDEKGQKDLYISEWRNGRYMRPRNLGKNVNSVHHEMHVYVSPDERYILFDSDRPNRYGRSDIFISFKTSKGWSKSLNLGEAVNSKEWDWFPHVSPDGKYLFFCRTIKGDIDIYWLQTKFIDHLKTCCPK